MILRSSAADGILIAGRFDLLEVLNIVGNLFSRRAARTDNSANLGAINERHVVERVRLRRERNHPQFVILKSIIDPHQRRIPIKRRGDCKRNAVICPIRNVFLGIEINLHNLL